MKQFSKDLGNVSLAPKGKWSREQEYERLALVYNACDNLSYVAKIDVPSGVDIENREYWQPMNATGYADNNFINLTAENENGTITAYETLEEAVATILPINRRAGATLSFYNLNSDRLDRQAEFELWQFNSTDLANWENKDYWNNVYYNWNVFVGWYIGADALKNHVKIPTVGQYAYVGSNLNDAILYQCRTNGTWTNTGTKVRNYISVVVSGNITIGDNGNWFSDGKDTGIPATPAVDEQLDNIGLQLQQHNTEIDKLQKQDVILKSNIDSNFETINNNVNTATTKLQSQITSNDNDIAALNKKHESLSKTIQGIAATDGASTATNVTYNNDTSRLNAENAQDAIDELQGSKIDKTSIVKEAGNSEELVMSQKAVSTELSNLSLKFLVVSLFDYSNVTIGKSINPSNGAISNVIKAYKLVKLHLSAGKYWIYSGCGSSSQATLWKYLDNDYASPEKEIVGSTGTTPYNQILTLEEGYYAFCWNDGSSDSILPNKAFFTDNISTQMLIDESATNVKNELKQEISSSAKSYGNLISDFSDFDILNNAFSISEDKASAQSLLTGYENRLQYNTNLYEDKFSLSSTLKIIDTDSLGYFEFCIGFWYQLAGTMFGIGKDENGSYISVYIVEQTLPPKQTHKYYISELAFAKGKEYTISVEKKTEKNSYFNISVTAQDGISVSKDGIGNGEVISGDTANEGNGSINGYAWGKLSFYALIGKMRVSNVCFGYPIDMNDVKLVVVGHSFIEGNSIPSDKDKRFASLLCSSIGDRKTIILGQGVASVNSIKPHIDKEMKWLKDAKYVLFCIGTNDADNSVTCTGLQYIDDVATKNGIKTIWLTVPPRYGIGDNHPVVNDYIRSHFHYVEIKDVFYNNDGVLDKNMFLSDNIHPSIEGHKRIYNLIRARCSFLKTI